MNEAAAAGEEALARGAGGAMLYDASCLHHPDTAVFDPAHWQAQGALETIGGGRGTVAFVRASPDQRWVLRHYRRGGLIAHLADDLYLWTGADRTRSFREWRLLRQLRAWGLPVPTPVPAHRVVLPGRCRGDVDALSAVLGVPVQRGPEELKDLPRFFAREAAPIALDD